MDVETKLDMVKDPTSGTDNYISQFVFESCEMRHEKREKRYFSIIVLLIVLLVATNVAWLFYEAQFQVQASETVTTTTTQTVEATQETADGDASLDAPRAVLKRRLIDERTFDQLSEEFGYSVQRIKAITYKAEEQLFKHI